MNDDTVSESREVAPVNTSAGVAAAMPTALALYLNDALFERVSAVAVRLSKAGGITPKHLIGQVEACFAVVSRAITWRLDPFAVAMATYQTPGGQIGFEGKLVLAILESSGRLDGGVRFEHYGDWSKVQGRFDIKSNDGGKKYAVPVWTDADARAGRPTDRDKYPLAQSCGVRVSAQIRGESERRCIDFDLIQAQPRNSTLWATDPKTQICYTAARRFANASVPALMMGVPFDPLDNMAPLGEVDITNSASADVINMPRSRSDEQAVAGREAVHEANDGVEATHGTADAPATETKAEVVDTTTGEVHNVAPKANGPDLTVIASDAQRRMIRDIAKRNGVAEPALDAALVERFTVTLGTLPMAFVNDAIALAKDLKPAAAAA